MGEENWDGDSNFTGVFYVGMRAKKRRLSTYEEIRNVVYLFLIAMVLLWAVVSGQWYAWALFVSTAYEFWPAGYYGKRGVE